MAALQAQSGTPVAAGLAQAFNPNGTALKAQFDAATLSVESKPAIVLYPGSAAGALHLQDTTTNLAIDVSLVGALPVSAQTASGYVVYPAALAGASVLHRALAAGTEDFIALPVHPKNAEVDFKVSLGTTVAGLRLVGGMLEFLDASGTPRLHVVPPYIVGADGIRTDGALAVADCAVDTDASPPWGRPVTSAGAATCTIKVTWPDAQVSYPAILDPRWTTTGSLGTARFEHTLALLSTGKTLAAGGRSSTSSTTALSSAELYDPSSGTWAATGSMAAARRLHSMTQLPTSSNATTSGKILVAGGISSGSSLTSAELYSVSAGTWSAAGTMNAARHMHTATLLADGRVLVAGGMTGTTTLATAATYNPASGNGSWAATMGPIPPAGLKNHTATLIQTTNNQLANHVLLVGGNNGTSTISAVYLYDPVQNAFSTLASLPGLREQHTAVILPNSNGKILVTGGKSGGTVLQTAVVFDPSVSNGTWSSAGTMISPRVGHTMTILPNSIVENGSVLVAGGSANGSTPLSSAELFSGTATWTATPSMPGALQGQQAVVVSGNTVLVTGGLSSASTVQNASYLYDASFGLACSSNSQCATGLCVSGVCCNTTCTDQCHACNVAGSLGTCSPRSNGSTCNDGNSCTVNDVCQAGACTGGTPKVCTASDMCHVAGTCDSTSGMCSNPVGPDKVGCDINLRIDGVVDMGNGTFMALFGHTSTATTTFHPTTDTVAVNGITTSNYQPAPPAYLEPGDHPGSFLPTFTSGQTIAWTVDGQTRTASASSPHVSTTPSTNGGTEVTIDGTVVVVDPNLTQYLTPPMEAMAKQPPNFDTAFNGTVPGAFSVSPSGAATYTVPIAIPPGIAGMAPNLALTYNSQGSDGIAGQGWDLTGLSMIHRCSLKIAQDGVSRPVQMDGPLAGSSGDGVCMDGKRLFQRTVSQSGGTFEPELQDFTSITLDDSGNTFSVVTKSGETRYYGYHDSSRVAFPRENTDGTPTTDGSMAIAVWALDRVVDQWGNYFDVQYNGGNADFPTTGIRPTTISYTGNLAGDSTFATVSFSYTSRPDTRNLRFRDYTIPKNQRLKSIGATVGNWSHTYTLTYVEDPAGPNTVLRPSRLQKITSCAATGLSPPTCAADLTFAWQAGGDYGWTEQPNYKFPATTLKNGTQLGTQLIDLDGDGRSDFVQAIGNNPISIWQNTGSGFSAAPPSWAMPDGVTIAKSDGTVTGGMFADFDGDGVPDFIFAPGNVPQDCSGWPLKFCSGGFSLKQNVYLNRIKTGGGWVESTSLETVPSSWGVIDLVRTDVAIDMNGDGLADIVRIGKGDNDTLQVLIAVPSASDGSTITWVDTSASFGASWQKPIRNFKILDLNRDGFPDIVPKVPVDSQGQISYSTNSVTIGMNNGHLSGGSAIDQRTSFSDTIVDNQPSSLALFGDIDGDGVYDTVLDNNSIALGVSLSTGGGFDAQLEHASQFNSSETYNPAIWTQTIFANATAAPFVLGLKKFAGPSGQGVSAFSNVVDLVDINADGLADVVEGHRDQSKPYIAGQVIVNNGVTFVDLDGAPSRQASPGSIPVPMVGYVQAGDASTFFVDLNGDGVPDVANETTAFINTYQPPIISGFPNGVAQNTTVQYVALSRPEATTGTNPTYTDTGTVAAGTTSMIMPIRVVSSVTEDNGIGSTGTSTYQYTDLRGSKRRGPAGFRQVTSTDNTSNIVTTTVYAQAFPYTGLQLSVTTGNHSAADGTVSPISETATDYCDTLPQITGLSCTPSSGIPGSQTPAYTTQMTVFIYPKVVQTTSYFRTSTFPEVMPQQAALTSSSFTYDAFGNARDTSVTMTSMVNGTQVESFEKDTSNEYGDPGSLEERFGKITQTTVKTQDTTPGNNNSLKTHITSFTYDTLTMGATSPLALKKAVVEPGAGAGLEVDTIYDYDRFGNVTTTLGCASDFSGCQLGAAGPAGDDPAHPPYRISQVSYDPNDFSPPAPASTPFLTALPYGVGRYPVRTTNALGQVQFTAYDERFGGESQRTAVDGVSNCTTYDDLGELTSTIDRCGATGMLQTFVYRFLAARSEAPKEKTVTVTQPPTGSPTWLYADALGRTIETVTRSFDGGFTSSDVLYDAQGRVQDTLPPYLDSEGYQYPSTTSYDLIGRVSSLSQDVGNITGGTPLGVGSRDTQTTYLAHTDQMPRGFTIQTDVTVNGVKRTTYETKNVAGKLVTSKDTLGNTTSYKYDSDGNLTDVVDPSMNIVHTDYDLRGRKVATTDPDLGQWTYVYDGFGDLIQQTDGKGKNIYMTYDALGRLVTKTDDAGLAKWVYVLSGPGAGQLEAMVGVPDSHLSMPCAIPDVTLTGNRPVRSFTYTPFGQVDTVTDCVDGANYVTTLGYDPFGRKDLVQYPTVQEQRFGVQYYYTASSGFLFYLTDTSDNGVIWAAKAVNALGQITDEFTRNGVETVTNYDRATGWRLGSASTAHANGEMTIANWTGKYDEVGNLLARNRSDQISGSSVGESFVYDGVDRLNNAYVTVSSQSYSSTDTYGYDALGNLTSKSGKTYTYTGCMAGNRQAGPHAVCAVNGTIYSYDGNGNMTGGAGRSFTYNPSNRVTHVESNPQPSRGNDTGSVDFVYGADGNRVLQAATGADGTTTSTVYAGLDATGKSLYERATTGSSTTHVQFIYAGTAHGGNALALRVATEDGTTAPATIATKYYHFDHLGSVTAMSDERGRIVDGGTGGPNATVFGYDPWGARRNPDGTAAISVSFNLQVGHREFTSHEAVPNIGLVNMNGRVYDPSLGRFVSPDPTIQFVANIQSYNRYSYALNNPLRSIDPTGYSVRGFFANSWVQYAGGFVLSVAAGVACSGPQALLCGVGILANFAFTAGSAAASNQPVGLAIFSSLVGFELGMGTGAAFGNAGPVARLIGGTVAGAIGAGLMARMSGQHLGWNVFEGAALGAVGAAVAIASQTADPVSEAANNAQGGGGNDDDVYDANRPNKSRDPVFCGAAGSPKCTGPVERLSPTDKVVVNDADTLRRGTNIDGLERGRDLFTADGRPQSGETIPGSKDDVQIPHAPKGVKDLGFEHTHPPGPGSNIFSWGDLNNTGVGQRAYLISPDGQIQVFDRNTFTISTVRPSGVDPTQLRPRIPIGP